VASYRVDLLPSAVRELSALPRAVQQRIGHHLDGLAGNPRPRGVRALAAEGGFLRLRVGDYRVIYSVDDGGKSVLVVKIGHRGEVYRKR